jgi:hypothetical protein
MPWDAGTSVFYRKPRVAPMARPSQEFWLLWRELLSTGKKQQGGLIAACLQHDVIQYAAHRPKRNNPSPGVVLIAYFWSVQVTITEAIRKHGLESLRGRAVTDGNLKLFISDSSLNDAIELWQDEPENAYRQKTFYGSELRGDRLNCWRIHGSFKVEI